MTTKTDIIHIIMYRIFNYDFAVMKFEAENIEITTYDNKKFKLTIEEI